MESIVRFGSRPVVDPTREWNDCVSRWFGWSIAQLDTTTGSVLWEWDSDTGAALTSPILFDDQLFLTSHVSGLYLIDTDSGEETWRSRLDHRQTGYMQTPLFHDCALYGITTKGFLERYSVCP